MGDVAGDSDLAHQRAHAVGPRQSHLVPATLRGPDTAEQISGGQDITGHRSVYRFVARSGFKSDLDIAAG